MEHFGNPKNEKLVKSMIFFFSCTLPSVGAGGGEQETNGLCVLSQNIINQKMYLVLWFWMTFLIMITPLCLIYRIITIWFDCFRSALLMGKLKKNNDILGAQTFTSHKRIVFEKKSSKKSVR